jgi:hypothetical protein
LIPRPKPEKRSSEERLWAGYAGPRLKDFQSIETIAARHMDKSEEIQTVRIKTSGVGVNTQ